MADYGKSRGLLDYISEDSQIRDLDKKHRGLFGLDPKVSGRKQPSIYRDVGGEMKSLFDDTMAMMPMGGITLKHGSPARFQQFLDEYKLTGEGANAYTSGHYLAQAHKVAMEYLKKLASGGTWNFTKKVRDKYQPHIDKVNKSINRAEDSMDSIINNPKGYYSSIEKLRKMRSHRDFLETKMRQEPGASMSDASGYLYTTKVKDDVYGRMLDWDKRLTQQKGLLDKIDPEGLIMKDFRGQFGHSNFHEGVKGAKGEKYIDDFFGNMKGRDLVSYLKGTPTWTHLIKNPHNRGTMHDVEGYLKSRGVPGIKYLDQESRPRYLHSLRKDVTPKKQTRNVVAYDPKDIEIINRQRWDDRLGLLD